MLTYIALIVAVLCGVMDWIGVRVVDEERKMKPSRREETALSSWELSLHLSSHRVDSSRHAHLSFSCSRDTRQELGPSRVTKNLTERRPCGGASGERPVEIRGSSQVHGMSRICRQIHESRTEHRQNDGATNHPYHRPPCPPHFHHETERCANLMPLA